MILVDDPSAFPADLLGQVGAPESAPSRPGLWAMLAPEAASRACAGPCWDMPFWHNGFLVARPVRSQFDVLRDFTAGQELTGPVWCLAAAGDACHGQHGRSWLARPGNLHLSAALTAPAGAMEPGLVLNGLAVVAALDAVRPRLASGARCGIKWVNDLWLEEAKVGGVLTAVRRRPDRDEVFLGIGLNVSSAPAVAPDRFTPRVTCLSDHATTNSDLAAMVPAVLAALESRWLQYLDLGPEPLVASYREASLVLGRRGVLWPDDDAGSGDPLWSGRIRAVGDDLGLLGEGRTEAWYAGRLELEPA